MSLTLLILTAGLLGEAPGTGFARQASAGLLGEAPGAGFLRMSHARAPVWGSSPDLPDTEQGGPRRPPGGSSGGRFSEDVPREGAGLGLVAGFAGNGTGWPPQASWGKL